ncbi:unnamed protein product [Oreochromis niloticus]|nr:unnamed protein product [Mustela putorius furo]
MQHQSLLKLQQRPNHSTSMKISRSVTQELSKKKLDKDFLKDNNSKEKFYTGLPSFALLMGKLSPGDRVLADQGFDIKESVALMGATLKIPAFTRGRICGLRCYTCNNLDPKSCTNITACTFGLDRCYSYSLRVPGLTVVTKGCLNSAACVAPRTCCEGDLCNSAIPTGPSAILLVVSSAILKFLF